MNFSKMAIIKSQPSEYYGERAQQLSMLASSLSEAGKEIILYANCPILISEFQKRKLKNKRIWLCHEPIGIKQIIIFSLLFPFTFILSLFFLIYLKFFKKIDSLYLVNIPEKVILTIPSRILRITVIWEESKIHRWRIYNPYRILWMIFSRFAKIFTYSNAFKNSLIKKGISKKIEVIYPGLNVSEFKSQESLFNAMAEQNLQSKKLFKIGTIGRLCEKAGLEYMLQALKIIVEIVPEAQLIIIASCEEKFNLNWLVRKLGIEKNIWFMGYKKEYSQNFKNFDLFVMPALNNHSINLSLIEAMAFFCPIIASNLEGINEIVKHNFSGVLVDPANSEMLAQTIINLYRDKRMRKEMGENGHKRARAVFNIERMMEDIERLV